MRGNKKFYCAVHGRQFKNAAGYSAHVGSKAHADPTTARLSQALDPAIEKWVHGRSTVEVTKEGNVGAAIHELEVKAAELQEKLAHVRAAIEVLRGH